MDEKLIVIRFLIDEIQKEEEMLNQYTSDMKRAEKEADGKGGSYWRYLRYEGRKPSKTRIQENCKKVRQLILEVSKEVEGI